MKSAFNAARERFNALALNSHNSSFASSNGGQKHKQVETVPKFSSEPYDSDFGDDFTDSDSECHVPRPSTGKNKQPMKFPGTTKTPVIHGTNKYLDLKSDASNGYDIRTDPSTRQSDKAPVRPKPGNFPATGLSQNAVPVFGSPQDAAIVNNSIPSRAQKKGPAPRPPGMPPPTPPTKPPANFGQQNNTVTASKFSPSSTAPPLSITSDRELELWNFYFGNIERTDAEQMLKSMPPTTDGAFLVRVKKDRTTAVPYSMSVLCGGKVYHIEIRHKPNGSYALGSEKDGEEEFASVQHMISHFRDQKLQLLNKETQKVSGETSLTESPPKRKT